MVRSKAEKKQAQGRVLENANTQGSGPAMGENWPERQEEDQRDPKKGQRFRKGGMTSCVRCC